ncbi:MAG: hypothetical protein J6M53_06450 [Bacteroidaceae bacterium]|nr:hypothetical protein [Bacteroidaceae bacterium]
MNRCYDAESVTLSVTAGTRNEMERTCGTWHTIKSTLEACPTCVISNHRTTPN